MSRKEINNLLDDLIKQAMALEMVVDKLALDFQIRRNLLLLDLKAIQLN